MKLFLCPVLLEILRIGIQFLPIKFWDYLSMLLLLDCMSTQWGVWDMRSVLGVNWHRVASHLSGSYLPDTRVLARLVHTGSGIYKDWWNSGVRNYGFLAREMDLVGNYGIFTIIFAPLCRRENFLFVSRGVWCMIIYIYIYWVSIFCEQVKNWNTEAWSEARYDYRNWYVNRASRWAMKPREEMRSRNVFWCVLMQIIRGGWCCNHVLPHKSERKWWKEIYNDFVTD